MVPGHGPGSSARVTLSSGLKVGIACLASLRKRPTNRDGLVQNSRGALMTVTLRHLPAISSLVLGETSLAEVVLAQPPQG